FFFFQAEDGIRDRNVTGVQTCALPIFDPLCILFSRHLKTSHTEAPLPLVRAEFPSVPSQVPTAVGRTEMQGGQDENNGCHAACRSEERRVGKEGREQSGRSREREECSK